MSIVVVGAKIQEREESKDPRNYSAWRSHDRDPLLNPDDARLCDSQYAPVFIRIFILVVLMACRSLCTRKFITLPSPPLMCEGRDQDV